MNTRRFTDVVKAGARVQGAHLFLQALPSMETQTHLAIVAPRRVALRATARNLLKRRGYSALRSLSPRLTSPIDGIFFYKKGAEELSFQEISHEMRSVLKKARLIS